MNIAILDDHELQAEGLSLILRKEPLIKQVISFNDSAQLFAFKNIEQVEVFLIDLHIGDENGIDIAKKLKELYPKAKVIMLTMQKGSKHTIKAERAQLDGYILKSIPASSLVEVIEKVKNGETIFMEEAFEKEVSDDWKMSSSIHLSEKPEDILSPREKEVLILICKEYSSSEIAEKLFLSIGTVDTHRKNILNKLGVSNTVGLVKYALKNNMI